MATPLAVTTTTLPSTPSDDAGGTTTTTLPAWALGNNSQYSVGPGQMLPTDAQCAKNVIKTKEVRAGNAAANHGTGNADAATLGNWGTNPGAGADMKRVSGKYTGTTDEIIQWASCKWGFDAETIRAQVMVESSWHQTSIGGFVSDSPSCVDEHLRRITPLPTTTTAPGGSSTTSTTTIAPVDPTSGTTLAPTGNDESQTTTSTSIPTYECPTAFGLLQLRSDFQPGTYPLSAKSTAYNLDYALAMERTCYDGVSWLGPQTRGDFWGCIGAFYSGSYLDPPAHGYSASVQAALKAKAWKQF